MPNRAATARAPGLRLWLDAAAAQAWAPGFDTLQLAHNAATRHAEPTGRPAARDRARPADGSGRLRIPQPGRTGIGRPHPPQHRAGGAQDHAGLRHRQLPSGLRTAGPTTKTTGFTILPGVSLIDALTQATQPEISGTMYAFSCYRATEYVTLLGIAAGTGAAATLRCWHSCKTLWSRRAIMSGEFHEVFLREQGSMEAPLPPLYYVPGDRIWFRNPDEASADASGFEGSWVMYMGGGLFTNFWKHHQPYTLVEQVRRDLPLAPWSVPGRRGRDTHRRSPHRADDRSHPQRPIRAGAHHGPDDTLPRTARRLHRSRWLASTPRASSRAGCAPARPTCNCPPNKIRGCKPGRPISMRSSSSARN